MLAIFLCEGDHEVKNIVALEQCSVIIHRTTFMFVGFKSRMNNIIHFKLYFMNYNNFSSIKCKQVSDVVPVACRAAANAGILSVCVTNFR